MRQLKTHKLHTIFNSGSIALAMGDKEEAGSRRDREKGQKNLLLKFKKRKNTSYNTIAIIEGVIGLIWATLPK